MRTRPTIARARSWRTLAEVQGGDAAAFTREVGLARAAGADVAAAVVAAAVEAGAADAAAGTATLESVLRR